METDFAATLARLRAGDLELAWSERRRLVARLGEALAEDGACPTVLALVHLLAGDPKWEVRSDVAELLVVVPHADFIRLAAVLTEDTNEYVRRAARRSLDRRRRGQDRTDDVSVDSQRLRSRWETFERRHGQHAATQAKRLADQQCDHLVGATVHEMRNVLTPLKGSVASIRQWLEDPAAHGADLRKAAGKVVGQVAFIERLLEDMRCFSQPPPVERRRERLLPIVQEAVHMASQGVAGGGRDHSAVAIELDVPENLALEMARQHFIGAVANVVKNAIESYAAGPKGLRPGKVRIAARAVDGEWVEIAVQDWGMEIDEVDLKDLRQFVPGRTSKKNRGTGFGLPIAEKNVRAHGGQLSLESQRDRGTTVTMVLPIEQQKGDEP